MSLAGASGTWLLHTRACAPVRIVHRYSRSWLVGPGHSSSLVFVRCKHLLTFEARPLAACLQMRGVIWGTAPRVLHLAFEDASRHMRLVMSVSVSPVCRSIRACRPRGSRCSPRPKSCPARRLQILLSSDRGQTRARLAMRASSLGVLKDLPSIDVHTRCPLPHIASNVLRSRLTSSSTRSVHVVSHDFDDFLHLGGAGLLHPAANHGIHYVSGCAFVTSAAWYRGTSPRRCRRLLRAEPVRVAVRVASRCRDRPVPTEVFGASRRRVPCRGRSLSVELRAHCTTPSAVSPRCRGGLVSEATWCCVLRDVVLSALVRLLPKQVTSSSRSEPSSPEGSVSACRSSLTRYPSATSDSLSPRRPQRLPKQSSELSSTQGPPVCVPKPASRVLETCALPVVAEATRTALDRRSDRRAVTFAPSASVTEVPAASSARAVPGGARVHTQRTVPVLDRVTPKCRDTEVP
jgi:hypothetical protein